MSIARRSDENPILLPNKDHPWEAEAVFNCCPVRKGHTINLLYRAVSSLHFHAEAGTQLRVSSIGLAESKDGIHFKKRRQFILPEEDWDRYGCEDPRVTKLGDKYYIFYTALSRFPLSPEGIRVGVAITKDFKKIEKHPVTPFNSKAMALFPERIGGKYWAILTANTDMPPARVALASFEREEDIWSAMHWADWYASLDSHVLPLQRSHEDHIEVGSPPVKTKHGWLVIYSYIRNYFSPNKIFGIEAVLLDLQNPMRIIGRTSPPIMVPEEEYERYGEIPNIVFPSGVRFEKGRVHIYYGAADSTCAVASFKLTELLRAMFPPERKEAHFKRPPENPILKPIPEHAWEAKAVFNPAAVAIGGKIHIVYRAMSEDNMSVFGHAMTVDGVHIAERDVEPIYLPREEFERKLQPGNSGCEDPRLTKIDRKIFMLYTAFDAKNPPRVALTSISADDFEKRKWNWSRPILISPPGLDDKDACIFPVKFNRKYIIFHRIGRSVDLALVDDLEFKKERPWLEEHKWLMPRRGSWDGEKVGIAAPPVKTKHGWVLLYHGVSDIDHWYRVGALLLDKRNPTKILARTLHPIFEPEMPYEKTGQVAHVVFPCGNVVRKESIYIYYGGGDSVVGVASIEIRALMKALGK